MFHGSPFEAVGGVLRARLQAGDTCQVIKAEASATAHCRGDGENTVRVTMDMSAKLGQDRNNESCKSNTPTVQYTVL